LMKSSQDGCALMVKPALDFASKVAPQLFSERARSAANQERVLKTLQQSAAHWDDIKAYIGNTSDFVGIQHANLQADNAYFWRDEDGNLDCGVFDFSGIMRQQSYVNNFMGCLSGADADLLEEYEEQFMRCFSDEYARYGGPPIDAEELVLRYRLFYLMCGADTCSWIEKDTLRELPAPEWKDIPDRFCAKFQDTWNARTRTTTFINFLELSSRRDLGPMFKEWAEFKGKAYITPYQ